MQATIMSIAENIETAAENAQDSYQQAQKYSDEASRSRAEMNTMTVAMDRISEASQKIENIISEWEIYLTYRLNNSSVFILIQNLLHILVTVEQEVFVWKM